MAAQLSIRTKVVGSVLLAAFAFLIASALFLEGPLQAVLRTLLAEEQTRNARRLADDLAHTASWQDVSKPIALRAAVILDRRVSIISSSGTVVADTSRAESTLDNHLMRPEIVEAREKGTGRATRRSTSTDVLYLYVAATIMSGTQVAGYSRIATPLTDVEAVTSQLRHSLLMMGLVATVIAVVVGAIAARLATHKLVHMSRIADEIGHGELGRRLDVTGDDEVGKLGQAVNLLAERLEGKLVRLTRDRALLVAVLDGIGEGVAFVDEQDKVLAANGAFKRLLGTGLSLESHKLRDVLPDPGVEAAVRKAFMTFLEARASAVVGEPPRDVNFRVLPTVVANVGTVALIITQDLSPNPRVETLYVEAANVLTRSLERANVQLPRDAVYALEVAAAARLLDEPHSPPEVALLQELVPRQQTVAEAPAVYVVRALASTAFRMLRLELGLRDEEALPLHVEIAPGSVSMRVEAEAQRTPEWAVPRSSESLGERFRVLRHQLAVALFEKAGCEVEDQPRKLGVRFPRA